MLPPLPDCGSYLVLRLENLVFGGDHITPLPDCDSYLVLRLEDLVFGGDRVTPLPDCGELCSQGIHLFMRALFTLSSNILQLKPKCYT